MFTVAEEKIVRALTQASQLLPNTTYRLELFGWTDLAGNFGSGLASALRQQAARIIGPDRFGACPPQTHSTGR